MGFEHQPWHGLSWRTVKPLALATGQVDATGIADIQVRNVARLAALGDLAAQQAHVREVIVDALADVLFGLELNGNELLANLNDIASLTLVTANRKLAGAGVMALDLTLALTPS